MRDSLEKAVDTLADRIGEQAKEASVDDLGKLAHAASELVHGPQGGQYDRTDNDTMDYSYTAHNHHHHHDDKGRSAGFGRDEP